MSHADPSPLAIRAMTALVIVGTFIAGAACGAGIYRWATPRPPPPPMGLPLRDLNLTAQQQEAAEQIGERHRAELEAILKETYPRVRAVRQQIEQEVRALLTADQQKKLDEIQSHRPPHGGPPPFGEPGHGPPPHDHEHGPRHLGPPPPEFF